MSMGGDNPVNVPKPSDKANEQIQENTKQMVGILGKLAEWFKDAGRSTQKAVGAGKSGLGSGLEASASALLSGKGIEEAGVIGIIGGILGAQKAYQRPPGTVDKEGKVVGVSEEGGAWLAPYANALGRTMTSLDQKGMGQLAFHAAAMAGQQLATGRDQAPQSLLTSIPLIGPDPNWKQEIATAIPAALGDPAAIANLIALKVTGELSKIAKVFEEGLPFFQGKPRDSFQRMFEEARAGGVGTNYARSMGGRGGLYDYLPEDLQLRNIGAFGPTALTAAGMTVSPLGALAGGSALPFAASAAAFGAGMPATGVTLAAYGALPPVAKAAVGYISGGAADWAYQTALDVYPEWQAALRTRKGEQVGKHLLQGLRNFEEHVPFNMFGGLGGGEALNFVGGQLGDLVKWGTDFGVVMLDSLEKLRDWNEQLYRSNTQFSEFSSAMAGVQVRQEVRDIQLEVERGGRLAETAEFQAESKHELNKAIAPFEDFWGNLQNRIDTSMNKYGTIGALGFGAAMNKLFGTDVFLPDEYKKGGTPNDMIKWFADAMDDEQWDTQHGR